ncbi:hypothetical protein ACHQM5_017100 [Ranunculus cassubicifolius]
MATQQKYEEDDDPIDAAHHLFSTLQIGVSQALIMDEPSSGAAAAAAQEQKAEQEHHLSAVDSTLQIRQVPSQGLSFQIWPAANTLVSLFQQHHRQPTTSPLSSFLNSFPDRPLRILELGSGTGLVGIAAAAILGAKVTITDLPHVVPNLVFNAKANNGGSGSNVDVRALAWGEAEDVERVGRDFDLVLGSDVVYHDHLYDPLLETLRLLLVDSEMVFVMAHLKRWKKESVFFKKARKMFRVETLYSDPPAAGARIGVNVYGFERKGGKKLLVN